MIDKVHFGKRAGVFRRSLGITQTELAERLGVTERLRAEDQMEWVRQMNLCRSQAEEVVMADLIYS